MTPTIENAIEIIRQLPPPEREKVRDWIDEEKQKESAEKEIWQSELEEKTKSSNALCNGLKKIRKNMTENSSFWTVIN